MNVSRESANLLPLIDPPNWIQGINKYYPDAVFTTNFIRYELLAGHEVKSPLSVFEEVVSQADYYKASGSYFT